MLGYYLPMKNAQKRLQELIGAYMRVKIARKAKHNGVAVAYVVKVGSLKFPRGVGEWYFPGDCRPETALRMAINDYENYLNDAKGE